MRAFHNDKSIKDKYIQRVKEHIELDEIVKGVYFEDGEPGKRRMCGVGCTIHSDEHSAYETELGIPEILARLEDRIFENIPDELAKTWPLRFLESINIGADLSKVWPKFAIFLLTDSSQCDSRHPQCIIVSDCYSRELKGEEINWLSVSTAAASHAAVAIFATAAAIFAAADAATYASRATAAADAAADASHAAADAADAAAVVAIFAATAAASHAAAYAAAATYASRATADDAYAAAYTIASRNACIAQSEKLLELLKEAR